MIEFQHARVVIAGEIGPPYFSLDGFWPNELGDSPEELVGRNVRCGDDYFVIIDVERISPTGHKFTVKPYQPSGAGYQVVAS